MPARTQVGPVLESEAEGVGRRNGPGSHDLKGEPRFLDRLHELGGLLRVPAPVAGIFVVGLFQLVGLGPGGVAMVVEGLDVEVRLDAVGFAGLDDVQGMAAHAGGHAVFLGQLDRLGDQVELALGHQRIGMHAPKVDRLAAVLDQLLHMLPVPAMSGLDRGGGADDPLNLAAALLAVTAKDRHRVRRVVHRDGVDAVGLGQGQGLHDLLVRVVVRRQVIDVPQIAAVRKMGQEVAAQNQAADLEFANPGFGQRAGEAGAEGAAGVHPGPCRPVPGPARQRKPRPFLRNCGVSCLSAWVLFLSFGVISF